MLMQTPTQVTITRKIGQNRGKPRLWIEGAHLTAAGFARGDNFTLHIKGHQMMIVRNGSNIYDEADHRPRKVSGKADKPIIDVAGASLGALGEAATVTLTYMPGMGIITGEANQ